MSLQRYSTARGDGDIPAWLLGQGGRQGGICSCGTHSRASPSPRSHMCYSPPQHPWVPCIRRHSLFPGCWVLGEYVGKPHCRLSSGKAVSHPPISSQPQSPGSCDALKSHETQWQSAGLVQRLCTTVTSLSFLSFLSFFFPRNHLPACHTPCLSRGCF